VYGRGLLEKASTREEMIEMIGLTIYAMVSEGDDNRSSCGRGRGGDDSDGNNDSGLFQRRNSEKGF
jgi:hypothetical protein